MIPPTHVFPIHAYICPPNNTHAHIICPHMHTQPVCTVFPLLRLLHRLKVCFILVTQVALIGFLLCIMVTFCINSYNVWLCILYYHCCWFTGYWPRLKLKILSSYRSVVYIDFALYMAAELAQMILLLLVLGLSPCWIHAQEDG